MRAKHPDCTGGRTGGRGARRRTSRGGGTDESAAADLTAWEDDEDSLTIEEKVAGNRDPDCPIWYDILPWDCPRHEWSEVEPNYEDDGTTLRIWNSRSCLNCGYTETIGEVECVPVENGPECGSRRIPMRRSTTTTPRQMKKFRRHWKPFDPTIDDPQYQREYERHQRDHGNQEEAEDVGSPVLYEETDDETC